MGEIRVPKLNNNDAVYTLLEWLVEDGERVRADESVASVETSKAIEELVAAEEGVLNHHLAKGRECAPGQVIGSIGAAEPGPAAQSEERAGPIITAPAQALLDELGIDPARVAELGVAVVRRVDVERLVTADDTTTLTNNQQAVARTVTLSHQTIPAGYTAIKVEVGAAQQRARAMTKELRKLVGLPDLLIAAVAGLHDAFPLMFAQLVDDRTAKLADRAHVGVTIDLGTGLFVPVIRDASGLSVAQIADNLAAHRRLAQHGGFREEQLSGGNIVVTLHHDTDIIMAIPIIFPGQACAIALTSPQREGERTVAAVGLAYDHRLINGRDAVLFLQALKEALEAPESL